MTIRHAGALNTLALLSGRWGACRETGRRAHHLQKARADRRHADHRWFELLEEMVAPAFIAVNSGSDWRGGRCRPALSGRRLVNIRLVLGGIAATAFREGRISSTRATRRETSSKINSRPTTDSSNSEHFSHSDPSGAVLP